MDAHYLWKSLLEQDSHVYRKKYKDIVDLQVAAFVLPDHLYSFSVAQLIPLIQDKCEQAGPKGANCSVDTYAELTWKDREFIKNPDRSETYVQEWLAEYVPKYYKDINMTSDEVK